MKRWKGKWRKANTGRREEGEETKEKEGDQKEKEEEVKEGETEDKKEEKKKNILEEDKKSERGNKGWRPGRGRGGDKGRNEKKKM